MSELKIENLKIVVIKSLYETISKNDFVKKLWGDVVEMKIKGYGAEYPDGILPFDSSDFFATHVILCEKGEQLRPISAMKSVTLDKCLKHRVDFPMLKMCSGQADRSHVDAVEKIINEFIELGRPEELAYSGSFTCDPSMRKYSNFKEILWDLTSLMLHAQHESIGAKSILAVCSRMFKVNKRKEKWGWEYLKNDLGELPPFKCVPLFSTDFVAMELRARTKVVDELIERYRFFWNSRMIIEKGGQSKDKKTA